MKEKTPIRKRRWYLPVLGILALSTLAGSLALIRTFIEDNPDDAQIAFVNYPVLLPIAAGLFALLAVFHLLQLVASLHESRLLVCKHLFYILFSACGSVFLLIDRDSITLLPRACLLYLVAVFIGCVISLMRKRSKLNVFLLIIMLLVLFLAFCGVAVSYVGALEDKKSGTMLAIILLFLVVDIEGVASIVPIAFSSVRMDVLKRIIRKTYAAEILFGIVLLIVAISFILPAFEYNITNFGDALWYCFAIVTTIGFGDITATSAIGRILSVILGLYGIIVVSLITSIIVNFYGEMKKEDSDETPSDPAQEPADQKDADQKDAAQKDAAQKGAAQKGAAQKDADRKDTDRKDTNRKDANRKNADQPGPAKVTSVVEEIEL